MLFETARVSQVDLGGHQEKSASGKLLNFIMKPSKQKPPDAETKAARLFKVSV